MTKDCQERPEHRNIPEKTAKWVQEDSATSQIEIISNLKSGWAVTL